MTKYSFRRCLIMLLCLLAFSCQVSRANMVKKLIKPRGPVPVKVKLYHNDTVMIVWWDYNSDGQCDVAYIYEKKDGYYVQKKLDCKQADEIDQFILEPRV